jgi:hypothetical protein
MRNPLVFVSAVILALLGLVGVGACMTVVGIDSGPSRTCVDWDSKKVKTTVTPEPKRTYNRTTKRWVNGATPKPYPTTVKTQYCEEWETESESPTPNNS